MTTFSFGSNSAWARYRSIVSLLGPSPEHHPRIGQCSSPSRSSGFSGSRFIRRFLHLSGVSLRVILCAIGMYFAVTAFVADLTSFQGILNSDRHLYEKARKIFPWSYEIRVRR